MFGKLFTVTLSIILCICANIFTQGVVLIDQKDSPSRLPLNQDMDLESTNKKSDLSVHVAEKRSPHYSDYHDDHMSFGRQAIIYDPVNCKKLGSTCWIGWDCCSGYCHWPDWNFWGDTRCRAKYV